MRRSTIITIAVVLVCSAVLGRGPALRGAQGSTPEAETNGGVTVELLNAGQPDAAPDRTLQLLRLTLAPGASLGPGDHTGAIIIYVESGTISFTVTSGEATFVQGCLEGCASPSSPKTVTPESGPVDLRPGDTVYQSEKTGNAYQNNGAEPAVFLVTGLVPAYDIPGATPEAVGTPIAAGTPIAGPAPTPPSGGPGVKPQGCYGGC